MSGDIEDFLRRAAERRKQQQGRKGPSSSSTNQRPISPPPSRPVPNIRPPEVVDAEIIEAEPVTGDDVAEEVARHLDNREFTERTSQLGEGVRRDAQSLQAHIEQDIGDGPPSSFKNKSQPKATTPFAAPLGKTTDTAAVVTVAKANLWADDIVALIRNPQTLRQAIVLSEIFSRPEDRW